MAQGPRPGDAPSPRPPKKGRGPPPCLPSYQRSTRFPVFSRWSSARASSMPAGSSIHSSARRSRNSSQPRPPTGRSGPPRTTGNRTSTRTPRHRHPLAPESPRPGKNTATAGPNPPPRPAPHPRSSPAYCVCSCPSGSARRKDPRSAAAGPPETPRPNFGGVHTESDSTPTHTKRNGNPAQGDIVLLMKKCKRQFFIDYTWRFVSLCPGCRGRSGRGPRSRPCLQLSLETGPALMLDVALDTGVAVMTTAVMDCSAASSQRGPGTRAHT